MFSNFNIFSFCKGDNQNNPRSEENLFQRREPDSIQKRHDYPSGASFDRPYDSKNSSFDHNNSAKVVDYGHGNKQGKIENFQLPRKTGLNVTYNRTNACD